MPPSSLADDRQRRRSRGPQEADRDLDHPEPAVGASRTPGPRAAVGAERVRGAAASCHRTAPVAARSTRPLHALELLEPGGHVASGSDGSLSVVHPGAHLRHPALAQLRERQPVVSALPMCRPWCARSTRAAVGRAEGGRHPSREPSRRQRAPGRSSPPQSRSRPLMAGQGPRAVSAVSGNGSNQRVTSGTSFLANRRCECLLVARSERPRGVRSRSMPRPAAWSASEKYRRPSAATGCGSATSLGRGERHRRGSQRAVRRRAVWSEPASSRCATPRSRTRRGVEYAGRGARNRTPEPGTNCDVDRSACAWKRAPVADSPERREAAAAPLARQALVEAVEPREGRGRSATRRASRSARRPPPGGPAPPRG